jgi:hypothetical protein
MRHGVLVVTIVTIGLLAAVTPRSRAQESSLVGTWTLVSVQEQADGTPRNVTGVGGLLIFDGGGHVFEIVTRPDSPPLPGLTEAQSRFYRIGGSWGGYRADLRGGTIAYTPLDGVSPNVAGSTFRRAFELADDRLTVTSRPGEPHTRGTTRWTWERMPVVENLSPAYRSVVGFWQHVVERRVNTTTGEVLSETQRAPSVIVYVARAQEFWKAYQEGKPRGKTK